MRSFEVSASDPKRLFGSSLRLLEEERFRKTCVPQLLRLESSIVKRCREFQEANGRPFQVQGDNCLDVLVHLYSLSIYIHALKGKRSEWPVSE